MVMEEVFKAFKPTHLSTMATSNVKGMNKLQTFIDDLGKTAGERKEALSKLSGNSALVTYIDGVTGQSAGWTFGKDEEDKDDPKVKQVKKNLGIT